VLSLGMMFVMVVCLEIAARAYAYHHGRGFSEDPRVFISPVFTTEDWPAPYKNGDVYEFKNGDLLTAKEARRSVVVVCLGGSTTLSATADGKMYPKLLEEQLQKDLHTSAIRVMNAGGNAFASMHSLVNFSLRILTPDIKPDVIVVYHNINDLSANYFGSETLPDYANKYMTDFYLAYPHKSGPLSLFLRQSRFFRFLYYRSNLVGYGYDRAPDGDYQTGAVFFERNLRSIAALAAANHVGVVIGTQPTRSAEVRNQVSHRFYNAVNRKVAAEFGDELADVVEAVTDGSDFIDEVHYSPSGVEKVAKTFYPHVRRLVEARLPSVNAVASVTRP
jgi:lysophospholipase L1-like esterase